MSNMRDVHNLDLNLVRIFNAVLDERGVTRAAERLHLTQSAVSHALARLREIIGDELFIRGPDGMHPTPRAAELAQSFKPALVQIEAALSEPVFNPATSEVEFSISTSDYITATIVPDLMSRMRKAAPNARCRVRALSETNITEELDRGTIHVAIGVFGKTPSRFVSEPLFSDQSVWLMRRDHPAASGAFGLRELSLYPQIDILISDQIQAGAARQSIRAGWSAPISPAIRVISRPCLVPKAWCARSVRPSRIFWRCPRWSPQPTCSPSRRCNLPRARPRHWV